MKYEYKTILISTKGLFGGKVDAPQLDNILNEMGNNSWELVQLSPSNQDYGSTRTLVCIFKRSK